MHATCLPTIEQGQQFESMVLIIMIILSWRNKQANKQIKIIKYNKNTDMIS